MKTTEAERRLLDAGAVRERREDRNGETKTGWWLNDVYLGKDAKTALEGIAG